MYARVWVCQPDLLESFVFLHFTLLHTQKRFILNLVLFGKIDCLLLADFTENRWDFVDCKESEGNYEKGETSSHTAKHTVCERSKNHRNNNEGENILDDEEESTKRVFFVKFWHFLVSLCIDVVPQVKVFFKGVVLVYGGDKGAVGFRDGNLNIHLFIEVAGIVAHRRQYVWVAVKVKHFPLCLCQEVHRPCRKPRPPS